MGRRETNEHGHVGCKGDAEEPSVSGKEPIAEVSDRLGVPLLDVFVIKVTIQIEDLLLVGEITGSRSCAFRFRGGGGIDNFGCLSRWSGDDNGYTESKGELSTRELLDDRENSAYPGSGPFSLGILGT